MFRKILIVDDNAINRQMLIHTLCGEYELLEAVNGREALDLIQQHYDTLSAILLDILMPEINGYEVLRRTRNNVQSAQIPIIMVTGSEDEDSRVKALSLGANDFILKPFNPDIIKHCLRNNIALRETELKLNAIQRDKLTGLYSREAFFGNVSAMIAEHEPGYYVLSCFDIDNFKLINNRFGTVEGDRILRQIGRVTNEEMNAVNGIGGRISADNYSVLIPRKYTDESITRVVAKSCKALSEKMSLPISAGCYTVSDTSLPASAIYDRAFIAKQSVKGQYQNHVAFFNDTMLEKLVHNQQIIADMDRGVAEDQFEVWFQPQHNHATGALVGAEALVRWRHPEKGLISPSDFITLFEQNGFIYELDKYVWENTCRHLRTWIDGGRNPLPVSVNVSRFDIFRPDIVDVLTELLEKYCISPELLRLEITESAFAESTQIIVDVAKQLIDKGFIVEIDDFGSGYSSLNTLKSVPAQILKLDMRFMEQDDGSQRTGNILESIIRMAKWLGMSVIAEGVEDKRQADYLASIGCIYIQGYLFSRPMPVSEYETYCQNIGKEEHLLSMETVANLDNNSFWDPQSMDTLIFNSYVGAACIFEYHNRNVELLRVNSKFSAILGDGTMSVEDTMKLNWLSCLLPEKLPLLRERLKESSETGEEFTSEYEFINIPGGPQKTYLRATMRVIATAGKRMLVYCTSENVTPQREAEERERLAQQKISDTSAQLQTMMNDMPGGFVRLQVNGETITPIYWNEGYMDLVGMDNEELQMLCSHSVLAGVHPDDTPIVKRAISKMLENGEAYSSCYRLRHGKGGYVWLSIFGRLTQDSAGDTFLNIYYLNATDQEKNDALQNELLDNLPGGVGIYKYDDGNLSIVYLNSSYWDLVGREPAELSSLKALSSAHPNDATIIVQEIEAAILQKRDITCEFRLHHQTKGYFPVRLLGRIVPKSDSTYSIYVAFLPIHHDGISIQEVLPVAMQAVMNYSSELSFVKDKHRRFITCSRSFAQLAGHESSNDLSGKTSDDLFPPELAASYNEADIAILKSGRSQVDIDTPFPTEDGMRHLLFSKYPLLDAEGQILGIFGSGRDITELRNRESRLEVLTNNIPGGIAVFEGYPNALNILPLSDSLNLIKLTYFSDGFCRLFGYSRSEFEEISAINPLSIVTPEDVPKMCDRIRSLATNGTPMDLIYRARVSDGTTKAFNIKAVLGESDGEKISVYAVFFDVTEQEDALEKLRISEEVNRLAVLQGKNVVCRYDIATKQLTVPENIDPIFEASPIEENVPYKTVADGNISQGTADTYIAFYEDIIGGKQSGAARFQQNSNIGWRWVDAHYNTIFSDSGHPVSAVISFFDITESVEKDAAYERWKRSFREREPDSYSLYYCNISKDSVLDSEEGLLMPAEYLTNCSRFSERTINYVASYVHPEDQEKFLAVMNRDNQLLRYNQGQKSDFLDYRELLPNGNTRWLRLSVDLVHTPSSDVEAYLLFENIDETKRAELEIIERAERDPLTGVYNRTTFTQKVDALIRNSGPNARHALLMLDIDGFKLVNDVFGHAAGDQILVDLADLLCKSSRRNDLVGRLGGDEFVLFLSDISGEDCAAKKAQHLCKIARKTLSVEVQVSGSVGVALFPQDGNNFDALYKKADDTLYYVKGTGKNNFAFYTANIPANRKKETQPEGVASSTAMPPAGLVGDSKQSTQKRRILIVDDSKLDCEMLSNIFHNDFRIEKAMDGNSALIKLHHFGSAISVVLLDLMMPGMDGFSVLEKMQTGADTRTIPVVVVSGSEDVNTNLRAIRSGAADYVTKPVDPDILRIRVQSAISKAENERLRAQNSFLELRDSETNSYKTVLERTGTLVIVHDWGTGSFSYSPSVSRYLAGIYDRRSFWHILMADLVADFKTVQALQKMEHDLANDRTRTECSAILELRVATGGKHTHRVNIYKQTNDFDLTDKLIITLNDISFAQPE